MKNKKFIEVILIGILAFAAACSPASSTTAVPQPTKQPDAGKSTPSLIAATAYPGQPVKPGASSSGDKPTNASGYPAPGAATQTVASSSYPGPETRITIIKADGSQAFVTYDVIEKFTKVKVKVDTTELELRKLSDLLGQAGVVKFTKLTFTATNGALTVTSDQAAQAYLEVAANAKINVPVVGIPKEKWPVGLVSIKIE